MKQPKGEVPVCVGERIFHRSCEYIWNGKMWWCPKEGYTIRGEVATYESLGILPV